MEVGIIRLKRKSKKINYLTLILCKRPYTVSPLTNTVVLLNDLGFKLRWSTKMNFS